MSVKQQFLRLVYPIWKTISKISAARNQRMINQQNVTPKQSIYNFQFELNNGSVFDMHTMKGKSFVIVNTASECGYTRQYEDLQALFEKEGLMIIGFPSNDFGAQEPGTDQEIASFCKVNYGVNFPLAKKAVVKKSDKQHPIFNWLSDETLNGWNTAEPNWNFCKYLIDEEGKLKGFFASSVEPAELLNYL